MIKELAGKLHEGHYSCVIANGTETRVFTKRGVADLYDLLKTDAAFLNGALVADKVVGKAAATLMALGGIRQLYADVISQPAITLLREHGIEVEAGQVVHHIENRDKSGWCPLETLSYPLRSTDDIFRAIEGFVLQMRQNRT